MSTDRLWIECDAHEAPVLVARLERRPWGFELLPSSRTFRHASSDARAEGAPVTYRGEVRPTRVDEGRFKFVCQGCSVQVMVREARLREGVDRLPADLGSIDRRGWLHLPLSLLK